MKKVWKHTKLFVGEDVILPDKLFETRNIAKQRLVYCKYVGETKNGILIECQYHSAFQSEDPPQCWRTQKFINFPSIYCGDVIVKQSNNITVKAWLEEE